MCTYLETIAREKEKKRLELLRFAVPRRSAPSRPENLPGNRDRCESFPSSKQKERSPTFRDGR
jgi:hypothetical protein